MKKLGAGALIVLVLLVGIFWPKGAGVPQKVHVPVLLFHHVAEEAGNAMTVTKNQLERVVSALKGAGFEAVDTADLIDYVENGASLPEKPVMITFDDGYESNITLAAPILEKYGMKATVFIIGVSAGKSVYKDSDAPIIPHFTWAQALENDIFTVESHSFDMHQVKELDGENCRYGVLKKDGESDDEYRRAFNADLARSMAEIEGNLGKKVTAFAYPYGAHSEESERLLKELGIKATFSIIDGISVIERGNRESLYLINRIFVYEDTSPEGLVARLGEPAPEE